jgi:hypothetical protein
MERRQARRIDRVPVVAKNPAAAVAGWAIGRLTALEGERQGVASIQVVEIPDGALWAR